MKSSSQTCPKARLIEASPQLRVSSHRILGYVTLTGKTSYDPGVSGLAERGVKIPTLEITLVIVIMYNRHIKGYQEFRIRSLDTTHGISRLLYHFTGEETEAWGGSLA